MTKVILITRLAVLIGLIALGTLAFLWAVELRPPVAISWLLP